MDYPRCVAIEFGCRCNGRCAMCPHGELDRRNQDLSDTLFEKIVRDLEEIPRASPTSILTNVVNEPFLDKKIFERLAAINQALPQCTIYIHTNFNAVPEDLFERLSRLRNIVCLGVSLNAANAADYRGIMGLDLERTARNLRRFLAQHRQRPFLPSPVLLTRIPDFSVKDEQYAEECRSLLREFTYGVDYQTMLNQRANWLGQVPTRQSPIPYNLPCWHWLNLCVFCNGVVPHCCTDAKGQFAIGDVNQQSILEIYNSRPYRNLRETMISRETAYPCNTCGMA